MPIYEQEIEYLLHQKALREYRESLQVSVDEADRLRSLAVEYPWLSPGVIAALARGGITDPEQVALAELDAKIRDNPQFGRRFNPRRQLKRTIRDLSEIGLKDVAAQLRGVLDTEDPALMIGALAKINWDDIARYRSTREGGGGIPGLGVIGDVAGQVGKQVGNLVGGIPGTSEIGYGLKVGVRTAALGANALYEGGIGAMRAGAPLVRGLLTLEDRDTLLDPGTYTRIPVGAFEQTQAGQAILSLARGEKVDVGSGLLPDLESKTARRAAEEARRWSPYLIGGHAWTPGRALANEVLTPDTWAFNIVSGLADAAVSIGADPTAIALRGIGAAGRAQRLISPNRAIKVIEEGREAARAVEEGEDILRGLRQSDDVLLAIQRGEDPFSDTIRAMRHSEEIAERGEQAFEEVMRRRLPLTARRDAAQVLYSDKGNDLVDWLTKTRSEWKIWTATRGKIPITSPISGNLLEQLAASTDPGEIRRILADELGTTINVFPKHGYKVRPRFFTDMPNRTVDLDDLDGTAANVDNMMALAKVAVQDREKAFNLFVRAHHAGDRYAAVNYTFDALRQTLIASGVPPEDAKEITRFWRTDWDGLSKWGVSQATGENEPLAGIVNGNELIVLEGPRLPVERLRRNVTLPDPREIRRMVADPRWKALIQTPQWHGLVGILDWTTNVWKTTTLLRPALTLRVVGEEFTRLAAVGAVDNPLSYVLLALGNVGEDTGTRWSRIKTRFGQYATDATGQRWDLDSLYPAGLASMTELTGSKKLYLSHFDVIDRSHEQWARAVVEDLARLHNDPVVKRAVTLPESQFLDELWEQPWGVAARKMMAAGRKDDDPWLRILHEREVSDLYGREVLRQLRELTADEPDLIEGLTTGKISSIPLTINREPTKEAIGFVRRLQEEGRGPEYVRVQRFLTKTVTQREEDLSKVRSAVNTLFDVLLTKPSRFFNSSPLLRKKYWDEVEDLIPTMRRSAAQRMIDNLEEAKLPKAQADRLRRRLAAVSAEDGLTLSQVDLILKRRAVLFVRDTLYDLSKRGQGLDALRIVLPFGEVWREVLTTWGRILRDQPQIARRLQQIVQGTEEAEINPFTGLPAGEGEGFFRWDPVTRQKVFTYPASGFISEALFGVPFPMKGPQRGLNMVAQGLPGIGPAISIPASLLIPDRPEWDQVAQILFPYGRPTTPNPLLRTAEQLVPPWMRKLVTAFTDPDWDRMHANTVLDVAAYLHSTGDYRLRGPDAWDEMLRLLNDAKEKSKWLFAFRGFAQAVLPVAPQYDVYVEKHPDEQLILLQKLRDIYREMRDEHGSQEAFRKFISKFGVNNLLATQAKTEPQVVGLDVSDEQRDWARRNRDLTRRFPHVWALLAPTGESYSPQAYAAQINEGQRVPLKVDEMVRRANARLGSAIYEAAKERLGGEPFTDAERDYLRRLRTSLQEQYPGYPGDVTSDIPETIYEIERMIDDPKVRRSQFAKVTRAYLEAREQANEKAQQAGLASFTTARAAAPLRAWLRRYGERLAETYPRFRRAWELVFSREIGEE